MSDTTNPVQSAYDAAPITAQRPFLPAGSNYGSGAYKTIGQAPNSAGKLVDVVAPVVVNWLDPVQASNNNAIRTANTAALKVVSDAIGSTSASGAATGLAGDIEGLTSAVVAQLTPLQGQMTSAQTMVVTLASLLAQQQSNGQAQAAILASMLRQEANQLAILTATNGVDSDEKTAAQQAHADAQAELAAIQATNSAIAQAHSDALAEISATQAAEAQAHADAGAINATEAAQTTAIGSAATQAHTDAAAQATATAATTSAVYSGATQAHADAGTAHTDAQAQATALALIHSDGQATATALATLHTDDAGLLSALQSLVTAAGTENTTLSTISLTDASVLATLKAILGGGTPFAVSSTTATTTTLFQTGANGSVLLSLALVCPNLLSGVLSGLASVTVFYSPSATATSGTTLDVVSLASGSSLALNPGATIPAGSYVRMTNATGAATAFGARKDL